MTLHRSSHDPEKRPRRPTKPADQLKSEWITFAVEPSRAEEYRRVAEANYYGVLSYFARAACDALVEQIKNRTGDPIP